MIKAKHLNFISMLLLLLPAITSANEGYSSAGLSIPANIYYKAFTIHTQEEACRKSPRISSIKLQLPSQTIYIGGRLHDNLPDDSIVSDFVIEAFDMDGKFIPGVPIRVEVYSVGRTREYNPGIVYRDGSMDYWEAKKPGQFAVMASWACASAGEAGVMDEVIVTVLKSEE